MPLTSLLTKRAEIQTPTTTQDEYGSSSSTWSAAATIPCAIESLSASERVMLGSIHTDCTHTVFAPFDAAIAEKDRLVIDGRIYEVVMVDDTCGRGRLLTITAKELR